MHPPASELLIGLGLLFLFGLGADLIGRHSLVPRVTILLIAGFAIGPAGLDLLPAFAIGLFPALTAVALSMIGFLLGGRLTAKELSELGPTVLSMSSMVVMATCIVVSLGLTAAGQPIAVALVLGSIATATAPAATLDVIRETGIRNRFTDLLQDIVAIDDLWGIIVFSIMLSAALAVSGGGAPGPAFLDGIREIAVAGTLGFLLGLPLALLTGQVEPGEPTQAEALGAVLLIAGLSLWLEVSYILTAIVAGLTVTRFARHHSRPFHAIEGIDWPFLVLFFFLAGASLEPQVAAATGGAGLLFVILRTLGRIIGANLGGRLVGMDSAESRRLGLALLPQAGVSIGLALFASQRLPQHSEVILGVVLGSTVVFEILGPLVTRAVLVRRR